MFFKYVFHIQFLNHILNGIKIILTSEFRTAATLELLELRNEEVKGRLVVSAMTFIPCFIKIRPLIQKLLVGVKDSWSPHRDLKPRPPEYET
jgi:hypothetical protein